MVIRPTSSRCCPAAAGCGAQVKLGQIVSEKHTGEYCFDGQSTMTGVAGAMKQDGTMLFVFSLHRCMQSSRSMSQGIQVDRQHRARSAQMLTP